MQYFHIMNTVLSFVWMYSNILGVNANKGDLTGKHSHPTTDIVQQLNHHRILSCDSCTKYPRTEKFSKGNDKNIGVVRVTKWQGIRWKNSTHGRPHSNGKSKVLKHSCVNHHARKADDTEKTSSVWFSHPVLPRIITKEEYDNYMTLMSDVTRLFESVNITLVMSGGTLLGSYMFHDMIPWDDDMDLWMPYRDVPKVKRLFRNETLRHTLQICSWGPLSVSDEYDYETLSSFPDNGPVEQYYRARWNDTDTISRHFFKVFNTNSDKRTSNRWKWPFIDVAVYDEDSEHIRFRQQELMFPWNVFYPLIRRPLGSNMLLAPHDTRGVLQEQFRHFSCVSTFWSHRLEVGACRQVVIECKKLWNHYPQVWSVPTPYGLLEKLMLGNKTLQTFEYRNNEYISHRPHDL